MRSSLEEKGQRASDSSGGLASFPVRVDEISKVDLAHVSCACSPPFNVSTGMALVENIKLAL